MALLLLCRRSCHSYNKTAEDFADKESYDNYLEEREDISEWALPAQMSPGVLEFHGGALWKEGLGGNEDGPRHRGVRVAGTQGWRAAQAPVHDVPVASPQGLCRVACPVRFTKADGSIDGWIRVPN